LKVIQQTIAVHNLKGLRKNPLQGLNVALQELCTARLRVTGTLVSEHRLLEQRAIFRAWLNANYSAISIQKERRMVADPRPDLQDALVM
jgi:hypothetical protein